MTTIPFPPQIGGMETVGALLARELVTLGCEVKVATATPSHQKDLLAYEVIRRPGRLELLRLYRWADAYLQHGPSLRFGWPVCLGCKPSFIVHHIWLSASSGVPLVGNWLRQLLLRRCRNLAVSRALGQSLSVPWEVVSNPYDDELFRVLPDVHRNRDLVFLGRLEPSKGVADLIDALDILSREGRNPTTTIVGSGSMKEELEAKVRTLGLSRSVTFLGTQQGVELVRCLNAHDIMVLPSRWLEPFGIVALEAIACGCVVIGSSGGGLPEAIGPCGVTFPNGDAVALSQNIQTLLNQPDLMAIYQGQAASHLAPHRPAAIARRYLEVLRGGFTA